MIAGNSGNKDYNNLIKFRESILVMEMNPAGWVPRVKEGSKW